MERYCALRTVCPGLLGRRTGEPVWLFERLQPGARQQVRGSLAVRAAGSEAQEGRSGNLGRDRLAPLGPGPRLGDAPPRPVSGAGRPAAGGVRGKAWAGGGAGVVWGGRGGGVFQARRGGASGAASPAWRRGVAWRRGWPRRGAAPGRGPRWLSPFRGRPAGWGGGGLRAASGTSFARPCPSWQRRSPRYGGESVEGGEWRRR